MLKYSQLVSGMDRPTLFSLSSLGYFVVGFVGLLLGLFIHQSFPLERPILCTGLYTFDNQVG